MGEGRFGRLILLILKPTQEKCTRKKLQCHIVTNRNTQFSVSNENICVIKLYSKDMIDIGFECKITSYYIKLFDFEVFCVAIQTTLGFVCQMIFHVE